MADSGELSECIELKYWIFKLVDSGQQLLVCVQGYRSSDDGDGNLHCWQSSPIVKILDPKVLVSVTGRQYKLLGRIDRDEAGINKYSHAVVKAFKDGFPSNWMELLTNEHERLNADDALNTSVLSSAEGINTTISSMNTTMNDDETEVAHPGGSERMGKNFKREPAEDEGDRTHEEVVVKPKLEEGTGTGKLKAVKDEPVILRRLSSSGRLIKPRLQAWAGERIVYDIDGNPIGAHSVTTKPVNGSGSSEKMVWLDPTHQHVLPAVPVANPQYAQAIICEELGVTKLEPSKQSYNRPPALPHAAGGSKRTRKAGRPAQRKSSTGVGKLRRRQLVNYSSSSSSESGDSFLDFIDSVSLSPSPAPSSPIPQQQEFDDGLTPIPLKWKGMNRRLITSPTTPFHPKAAKRVKREEESDDENNIRMRQKKRRLASKDAVKKSREAGRKNVADKPSRPNKMAAPKLQPKGLKAAKKTLGSFPSGTSTSSDETIVTSRRRVKSKSKKAAAPKRAAQAKRAAISKEVKKEKAVNEELRLAESHAPASTTPPAPKKNKRWNGEEVKRLRMALKAAQNPKSAEDWEFIARSVSTGEQRSGEECKKHALEVLKWNPPDGKRKRQDGDEDESADSSSRLLACEVPSSGYRRAQPERAAKKSVGGVDFFAPVTHAAAATKRGRGDLENTRPLIFPESFSSLELSADDSMLSALRSPEERIRNIRKPFIPKVLNTTSLMMGRASLGSASNTSQ